MHVQMVAPQTPQLDPTKFQQLSSDTETDTGFTRAAAAAIADGDLEPVAVPGQLAPDQPVKQQTVVKDDFSKTPRNAPCPCGSGKKFKMCHGAS
jgi:preprotein translocase subunit SecA